MDIPNKNIGNRDKVNVNLKLSRRILNIAKQSKTRATAKIA